MMRQQQHPESEDFMLEEDDTAHQQHKRNVAPANSLSKKLQKNKDAAAAGHVKKSPLFHHVPPGSPSSHNSIMDSKKMLRIRTRINHIED